MTRQRRGSNHRGVGVAHWRRKQVLKVPAEVLHLWNGQMALGRHNDLLEIKRSSPLVILEETSSVTQGLMWLHFIDNAVASSCLVNGSSSVCEGDVIIGETWRRIQG